MRFTDAITGIRRKPKEFLENMAIGEHDMYGKHQVCRMKENSFLIDNRTICYPIDRASQVIGRNK